jgi:hypothetical protein
MTPSPFRVEIMRDAHDRKTFRCGEDALDRYFHAQATQDIRRRIANCFVAVHAATGRVAEYYTLSAASMPFVDLPPEDSKRLPRYLTCQRFESGDWRRMDDFRDTGWARRCWRMRLAEPFRPMPQPSLCWLTPKTIMPAAFYRRHAFRALLTSPECVPAARNGGGNATRRRQPLSVRGLIRPASSGAPWSYPHS